MTNSIALAKRYFQAALTLSATEINAEVIVNDDSFFSTNGEESVTMSIDGATISIEHEMPFKQGFLFGQKKTIKTINFNDGSADELDEIEAFVLSIENGEGLVI